MNRSWMKDPVGLWWYFYHLILPVRNIRKYVSGKILVKGFVVSCRVESSRENMRKLSHLKKGLPLYLLRILLAGYSTNLKPSQVYHTVHTAAVYHSGTDNGDRGPFIKMLETSRLCVYFYHNHMKWDTRCKTSGPRSNILDGHIFSHAVMSWRRQTWGDTFKRRNCSLMCIISLTNSIQLNTTCILDRKYPDTALD
jgi:hypothetical protein